MPKRMLDKLSPFARIAISAGAAAVFALLVAVLLAFVASFSEDPAKNLTLYGEICFLATMLFGGLVGAKMGGETKIFSGVISGAVILALVILPSLFVNDGGILKALVMALLGMFVCVVGAAVGSRESKRRKHR